MLYLPHFVVLVTAAIWPASAMPLSILPDAAIDQKIHARGDADEVPLEGFDMTIGNGSTQKILVESFDHKATPTLTTTLTISGHPTAYTIKPSNTPIAAATITGRTATVACYPTFASIAGTQYTNCVEDTVTTFGAKHRTGMTTTVEGTHTLSLGPNGGLVVDGSSTHIGHTTSSAHPGGPSPTTHSKHSQKSDSTATGLSTHSGDSSLFISGITTTPDPTGFQVGTTSLAPGGHVTTGTNSVSLGTGSTAATNGNTIPSSTKPTPTATSSEAFITLSGSSTTGLYGIKTLSDMQTLTAPTIITTKYVESGTHTTTGPVYVASGGIVLNHWPPDKTHGESRGGKDLDIFDPIKPSKSNLKCPSILSWLCGPDHSSSSDFGSGVDTGDEPNSNPKDNPDNPDENNSKTKHTSSKTSSTSSKASTSSPTSSCATSQTATNCDVKCSMATAKDARTATTTCFTTSCSQETACSATGTTSTMMTTSKQCGSTGCPTPTLGPHWVYPVVTLDTAELNQVASSIMSADSNILASYSANLTKSRVSPTTNTSSPTSIPTGTSMTATHINSSASTTSTDSATHTSSLTTKPTVTATHTNSSASNISTHSATHTSNLKTKFTVTATSTATPVGIQIYSVPCPTPNTFSIFDTDGGQRQISDPCSKEPYQKAVKVKSDHTDIDLGPFTSHGKYKNCHFKATGWATGKLTCDGLTNTVQCKVPDNSVSISVCGSRCPVDQNLAWYCEW